MNNNIEPNTFSNKNELAELQHAIELQKQENMNLKKQRKRSLIVIFFIVILAIFLFQLGIGLYYNRKIEDYRLQIQQQEENQTQFLNQFDL